MSSYPVPSCSQDVVIVDQLLTHLARCINVGLSICDSLEEKENYIKIQQTSLPGFDKQLVALKEKDRQRLEQIALLQKEMPKRFAEIFATSIHYSPEQISKDAGSLLQEFRGFVKEFRTHYPQIVKFYPSDFSRAKVGDNPYWSEVARKKEGLDLSGNDLDLFKIGCFDALCEQLEDVANWPEFPRQVNVLRSLLLQFQSELRIAFYDLMGESGRVEKLQEEIEEVFLNINKAREVAFAFASIGLLASLCSERLQADDKERHGCNPKKYFPSDEKFAWDSAITASQNLEMRVNAGGGMVTAERETIEERYATACSWRYKSMEIAEELVGGVLRRFAAITNQAEVVLRKKISKSKDLAAEEKKLQEMPDIDPAELLATKKNRHSLWQILNELRDIFAKVTFNNEVIKGIVKFTSREIWQCVPIDFHEEYAYSFAKSQQEKLEKMYKDIMGRLKSLKEVESKVNKSLEKSKGIYQKLVRVRDEVLDKMQGTMAQFQKTWKVKTVLTDKPEIGVTVAVNPADLMVSSADFQNDVSSLDEVGGCFRDAQEMASQAEGKILRLRELRGQLINNFQLLGELWENFKKNKAEYDRTVDRIVNRYFFVGRGTNPEISYTEDTPATELFDEALILFKKLEYLKEKIDAVYYSYTSLESQFVKLGEELCELEAQRAKGVIERMFEETFNDESEPCPSPQASRQRRSTISFSGTGLSEESEASRAPASGARLRAQTEVLVDSSRGAGEASEQSLMVNGAGGSRVGASSVFGTPFAVATDASILAAGSEGCCSQLQSPAVGTPIAPGGGGILATPGLSPIVHSDGFTPMPAPAAGSGQGRPAVAAEQGARRSLAGEIDSAAPQGAGSFVPQQLAAMSPQRRGTVPDPSASSFVDGAIGAGGDGDVAPSGISASEDGDAALSKASATPASPSADSRPASARDVATIGRMGVVAKTPPRQGSGEIAVVAAGPGSARGAAGSAEDGAGQVPGTPGGDRDRHNAGAGSAAAAEGTPRGVSLYRCSWA